jgi:NADH:ubiquinone oxidoreductase subunit 3 (subunit A)
LLNLILEFTREEKWPISPLEAGFISRGRVHKNFSLQFFLLIIIFVIFDLEILLVFALIYPHYLINFVIVIFLGGTLLIEWK